MPQERLSLPFVTQEVGEYLDGPPRVAGIVYLPGKSMSPHFLPEAFVDQAGIRPFENSPVGDRQFMLTNPTGKMESQRSLPAMARLQLMATDKEAMLVMDGDSFVFGLHAAPEIGVKVHTTDGIAAVDQGDDVAHWLFLKFGRELRLVRQMDERPRKRAELLPQMAGIEQILRLQDSSTLTALSHPMLKLLNDRLVLFDWYMEALSFRMNFMLAGEINEHKAVGKFLRFGPVERAVYTYVWRPKERCVLPAVDQTIGIVRGAGGQPRERMSYIFQEILKEPRMHASLGIPLEWQMKPSAGGGGDIPKAMLGIDMFPINKGIVRVGDLVGIVDDVPADVMGRF